MKRLSITLSAVFLLLVVAASAQSRERRSKSVERFVTLPGNEQVREFFAKSVNPFSAVFHDPGDCLTEQEVLVTSRDSSIDSALVAVLRGKDSVRGGFAAFLICKRTQFVAHDQFVLQGIEGRRYSTYAPYGLFNPFSLDFSRVSSEAHDAVMFALDSADEHLRTSARLYCGDLKGELARRSTVEIAVSWRTAVLGLTQPIAYRFDGSEAAEHARVLTRELVVRGIEGANELAKLLQSERKPVGRELEFQVILDIDRQSVRLRGSKDGQRVIDAVRSSLTRDEYYFSRTLSERQKKSRQFEDMVLHDDDGYVTEADRMMLESFQEFYGEQVSGVTAEQLKHFHSQLTAMDPSFPSWEFASTGSFEDILHPRFREKMDSYYKVWKSMH